MDLCLRLYRVSLLQLVHTLESAPELVRELVVALATERSVVVEYELGIAFRSQQHIAGSTAEVRCAPRLA